MQTAVNFLHVLLVATAIRTVACGKDPDEHFTVKGGFFDVDLFEGEFKSLRKIQKKEIDFRRNGDSFYKKNSFDHQKKRNSKKMYNFGSQNKKKKSFSFLLPAS